MFKFIKNWMLKATRKQHVATAGDLIKDKASHAMHAMKGQAALAISGVGTQVLKASTLLTGIGVSKLDPHYTKMIIRHAMCMVIAWGFLAPLTIIMARYGRFLVPTRYKLVQLVSYGLMVKFGLMGGIYAFANARSSFGTYWHHYLGACLGLLTMVDGLLGIGHLFRHQNETLTKALRWLTPTLWIVAIGNAFFGSKFLAPILLGASIGGGRMRCARCILKLPSHVGYYVVTMAILFAGLEYFLIRRRPHGQRVLSKRTTIPAQGSTTPHRHLSTVADKKKA